MTVIGYKLAVSRKALTKDVISKIESLVWAKVRSDRISTVFAINSSKVHAFELKIPTMFRKLWTEIKEIAEYLKEAYEITIEAVIKAFKERSVFALLKGLGFSLVKLTKAVSLALKLPSSAVFHALDALVEEFGSSKLFMALDAKARLQKLEAVIRKHPVLTRLTGLTIAGLIFIIYIKAPFIGDVAFDFDLVDSMVAAIKGNFNLAEFFTSPDAIHTVVVLLFGGLSGGVSLLDYGAGALAKVLTFMGSHAEDVSAVLLAVFTLGQSALGCAYLFRKNSNETRS